MNITCSSIAKAAGLEFDRKVGGQIIFKCPNHEDLSASLTINPAKNVWMCGPCGKNGGAWAFAFFISNSQKTHEVINWLVDRGIMEERTRSKSQFVKSYTYKDPEGKEFLLVKKFVDRDNKKSFAIYHKDETGEWKAGTNGVKLYPYRINEWKDKPIVYIVEGEKDADAMWQLGIPATTNPMGANSWKPEYNDWFRGKKVVIIPDNDDAGRKHAKQVLANIIEIASGVKVVVLPGVPPKGDFSDWLTKCSGTTEALRAIVVATPWATLEDAGLKDSETMNDAKIMVRRMCYDIGDLYGKTGQNFDSAWAWMKDNQKLWDRIKESESRLDESCADKDSIDIIKARCIEWKSLWKDAIQEFLEWRANASNSK